MVHLYKELQPTDGFEIRLPHLLSSNERQLITLLYQPLTGSEPISLYLTLWAEAEDQTNEKMNHYHLMNLLGMSIGQIFEARIALEAIGLLRTWRKDIEQSHFFIYELQRPLDGQTFFKDPLLSMFLFSKIGEYAYRKLRNRFAKTYDTREYQEVSRTFVDVYKPVHTNIPQDFTDSYVADSKRELPFYYEQFDFDLLMSGLSEQLVPSKSITLEVKKNIAKLAFLYQLSPIDMQKIVILSLDDNMHITMERLKKSAADYYKLTVSKEPPKMTKTFENSNASFSPSPSHSKEEEHLHYLETTPPIQLLRDITNGKEPVASSVQLAEELIVQHDMPIGVVNVLLEYVMLTTDMKLPRKYVERIADHWMRKNLRTAKEAMELARKERDQYNKWKQENEKKKQMGSTFKSNKTREEKIPDWFYHRNESSQNKESAKVDFEKERQKILKKLDAVDGQVN